MSGLQRTGIHTLEVAITNRKSCVSSDAAAREYSCSQLSEGDLIVLRVSRKNL